MMTKLQAVGDQLLAFGFWLLAAVRPSEHGKPRAKS
jgi:hypothetical protein